MKIAIGIITILIIVGGGTYLVLQSEKSADVDDFDIEKNSVKETREKESGIGSLASLMKEGKNIECTFEHTDNGNVTTGKAYISGERMRGDFSLTQPNGAILASSVVRDGEYGYMWGDPYGDSGGVKLKLSAIDDTGESVKNNYNDSFLDEDSVSFDCTLWTVDETMLQPPTDIEFQDISAEVMEIQDVTTDSIGSKCDICSSISDEAGRSQCLEALGC